MLALSDATIGGLFGLVGVIVTTVGVIAVALLTRSTKKEAKGASDGVVEVAHLLADALARVAELEEREQDCLDALEWAHNRIAALEAHAGMPVSPRPASLGRRRRST